ncbi:MAG TPA: hypothetical protein DEQ61_08865 [Streptomyces sp.]|nr:hypothetical protein [Streptomyces sp.]
MGSLRSPVGPLPSSIYWRRRAVALSLFALLALLVIWAVNSGGGAGGDGKAGGASGNGPAESITPGPSSSGPAISERPGGRDESGGGNGSGSGGSGGSDSGAADGGSGADGGGAGDGGQGSSAGGAGASGGSGGGSGGGNGVPAGTKLPDCGPGAVELRMRSVKNTYAPGEKPELELTAENSSGSACEIDFGTKSAVLTITFADDDDPMWASDDCLRDSAGIRLRVPAGGANSYTVKWDRKPSEPKCATPSGGSARAGTYLAEAETEGGATAQASFVLAKD